MKPFYYILDILERTFLVNKVDMYNDFECDNFDASKINAKLKKGLPLLKKRISK